MRNLLSLCISLFFVFTPVFSYSSFVGFGADYNAINECLDNALKLKEVGDINGAISSIKRVLSIANTVDSIESESGIEPDSKDIYTKEYLQTLIDYLNVDKITYIAVVNRTTSIIKKTRDLFFEIADELKTEEISKDTASKIKEMKLQMSRELVTHNFCVPPEGYEEVYNVTQAALFWYSKAWGNLELIASEKTNEKVKIGAEALFSFQKGNELFSQAGTLMLAIPKR